MKNIVIKIKKQESKGYKLAFVIINSVLRWSIPVNKITKPLFKIFYLLHISIRESFIWIVKSLYYEPLFKSQCFQVGKKLWMEKLPYISGTGNIHLGNNIRMSGKINIGFNNRILSEPTLVIGDNTFIGHNASLTIAKLIEIGNNCLIAGETSIMDNDGHPLDYSKRRDGLPVDIDNVKSVIIGNDVWIGARATIMKGVVVGDRSIVGAGSVVTKSVPPDCIVAGNPASIIRSL